MGNVSPSTVVLIPGMGNTAALWAGQSAALHKDFELVVPDYRGCSSISQMADAVIGQMPETDVALAGFSLGGYIALEIARRYPERLQRLAIMSSSPFADTEAVKKQRLALSARAEEDYPSLLSDMAGFVVYRRGPHAEAARQAIIEMGLELGAEEFCRQQTAAMAREDSLDLLPVIHLHARVLCGDKDRVTPLAGNQRIAEEIPNASLQIVENAGHLLPIEQPEKVSDFLRAWLTQ